MDKQADQEKHLELEILNANLEEKGVADTKDGAEE